jgi:hypothetical protein
MAAPYLVGCLVQLRSEFNAMAPNRDKGADGWIGDTTHQKEHSDHNPDAQGRVLALDIDSTGPWPGGWAWFNSAVLLLVAACRIGRENRLQYVIWNRKIASISSRWQWEPYTGTTDPHTGHAHFSARHDHYGNSSSAPWGVEEESLVAIDDADAGKIASKVWGATFGDTTAGKRLAQLDAVPGLVSSIKDLTALVRAGADVDETALANALAPALAALIVIPEGASPEEIREQCAGAVRDVLGGLNDQSNG